MAKNQRLKMGMARQSSKTREKELIKIAKRLAKDPEIILPVCTEECLKDPFLKVRKQLGRIKDAADDEDFLLRYSKKGDPLARAVAGTILLKHAGKVPILAVLKTSWGEASYAMRGKTTKERLVGVQNLDNPIWRIFAIIDIVKKKKVYVYSDRKKMICTGRNPHPPADFVDWDIKQLPYSFLRSRNIHHCKHLKPDEIVKDKVEGKAYIYIHWVSADRIFALCEQCADKENVPALLSRYMTGPKVSEDFELDVRFRPTCGIHDCSLCTGEWTLERNTMKAYQKGQLFDKDIITSGKKIFESTLTGSGLKIYMAGGVCYGEDMDAFIDSFNPDEVERTALEEVLEAHDDTIITDSTTIGKILGSLWDQHGLKALNSITGDPKMARELYSSYDVAKTSATTILKDASRLIKVHAILSTLPSYSSLPADWEYADNVARIYRTDGKEEALRMIIKSKDIARPVAWAFLRALEATAGKDWMFKSLEMELGDSVKDKALELIFAESEDYHEALTGLMRAVGSSAEVTPD